MNLVEPVPAALAGLALFFLPGLLLLALLRREDREALAFDEALYLAVAASVMAAAWVGLVLAELGRFSLTVAGALLAGATLLGALACRRRLAWPLPRPASLASLAPPAAVLALAFALQARPSQYIVGGRDPGAYVAAMGLIARTGGILYTDPAVLSIPPQDVDLFYRHAATAPPFSWARFLGFDLESPATGRVFPEFFHLFPAFGAYLFQSMGLKGALATPPLFGILGTLGVYFALRRLLGAAPALLAALLLAANVLQVWFARYPVSETVSQFLMFAALLAFALWEERGAAAFGALAGVALGLTLLVRIDSLLVVFPLGLYLIVRRARGELPWRRAAALLVPFLLLAIHATVHALVFSKKYALDIVSRPYWRQPPEVWVALAAAAALALATAHRTGPALGRALAARRDEIQVALMAALVALALYAYLLRPALSAWAGADGHAPGAALPDPGLLRALSFRRLAAHDAETLVRLGWFVHPLGLALGLAGLLLALREWRDRLLFPVLMFLVFSAFYLYKIRVFADYPFAMRRFVFLIVPLLLGFAALLLGRLARGGGGRRVVAGALAVGLAGLYVRDTLPIARYTDWRQSVEFVRHIARRFGPQDAVIFEQPKSIHLLSLPLWASYGLNVLELARFNPDPDSLQHLLRAWRGRYRNVYFVHTYRTDLCGVFLQRVEPYSFTTLEWYAFNRRPGPPEPRALHFTLSRFVPPEELQVPALAEVDVGGSDDFQVSGFFEKEGSGEETYRWTGPCASVYLPGARARAEIAIRARSGPERPASSPASVRASLSGAPLGSFVVGPDWEEHALALPDPLPPGPPVLRLDVPAWRPANVVAGSLDTRDLGVMVDRIRIGEAGAPRARIAVSPARGGAR